MLAIVVDRGGFGWAIGGEKCGVLKWKMTFLRIGVGISERGRVLQREFARRGGRCVGGGDEWRSRGAAVVSCDAGLVG